LRRSGPTERIARIAIALCVAHLGVSARPASGEDEASGDRQPVDLRYTVTMPADFDSSRHYPAVLALPPGPQNEDMVEVTHQRYWDHAEQRGWIVVSPVAPQGRLFFQGAEVLIPGLLDAIAARLPVEAGRFHIAGISNGGISAFRIAENDPERFCSVVVFPGLPGNDRDFERLSRLKGIPVHMYAGEGDARWVTRMRATEARLRELDSPVKLTVFPDEGHVIIRSLSADDVFDLLDAEREGCRERGS
jgi:dipeptidyl aminopeptidase/acylaminoacyl peptidase